MPSQNKGVTRKGSIDISRTVGLPQQAPAAPEYLPLPQPGGGGSPAPDDVTLRSSGNIWSVKDGGLGRGKLDPDYEAVLPNLYQARHAVALVTDLPDPPGTDEWLVLVVADALADNGIYIVSGDGLGGSTVVRYDQEIRRGTLVLVADDQVYGDSERSLWIQVEPGPIILGTDAQTYERAGAVPILYDDTTFLLNPRVADLRSYCTDGSIAVTAGYSIISGRAVPGWKFNTNWPMKSEPFTGTGTIALTTRLAVITGIAGPISLTLPAMASYPLRQELVIKDESGAVSAINTVTIIAPGYGLPGAPTTIVMNTAYQFYRLYHNGTLWFLI